MTIYPKWTIFAKNQQWKNPDSHKASSETTATSQPHITNIHKTENQNQDSFRANFVQQMRPVQRHRKRPTFPTLSLTLFRTDSCHHTSSDFMGVALNNPHNEVSCSNISSYFINLDHIWQFLYNKNGWNYVYRTHFPEEKRTSNGGARTTIGLLRRARPLDGEIGEVKTARETMTTAMIK